MLVAIDDVNYLFGPTVQDDPDDPHQFEKKKLHASRFLLLDKLAKIASNQHLLVWTSQVSIEFFFCLIISLFVLEKWSGRHCLDPHDRQLACQRGNSPFGAPHARVEEQGCDSLERRQL